MGKSNLCEDKTAKRMNHVTRMLYGSLSQKYSNKEIADKLGWSIGTVTNILREKGFGKPVSGEEVESLVIPVRRPRKHERLVINGVCYKCIEDDIGNMEGDSIWST